MSGELGPEARGIVDAGRDGDDPRPADRTRVRASLMQAIAVGGGGAVGLGAAGKAAASVAPKAAATAATAAAAKTVSTFGVAKLIGVVAVIAVVGGGGYTLAQRAAGPATTTTTRLAEAPIDRATEAKAPLGGSTSAATAAPTTADSPSERAVDSPSEADRAGAETERSADVDARRAALPRPGASGAALAAPAAPAAPERDPLTIETQQISEAEVAIQAGDARRALAILDAPAPGSDGQLSEERSATRVFALCKLGRLDEAKAAASRFVAEHPRSPVVDRMRHACDEPIAH